MKNWALSASSLLLFPIAGSAGTVDVAHTDITVGGGAAAGYLYSTNTGSDNQDDFHITDFLLDVSGETKSGMGMGMSFNAGLGLLRQPTVYDGGVSGTDPSPVPNDIYYGSLTATPMEGLDISVGQLATNIGYEVAPTFANANMTLGALWNAQPVYYPGGRVTYSTDNASVFAEVNNDTSQGATNGWAIGASAEAMNVSYAVNYYNADGGKDMVDLIASSTVAGLDVGANLDYHILDDEAKTPGMSDDSALGLGLYVTPKFGAVAVPLRGEYLSDGDTGVYGGVDTGFTVTATPTYYFDSNAFVRAEVAFVSSDKKVFTDDNGNLKDSNTSAALQMGYMF